MKEILFMLLAFLLMFSTSRAGCDLSIEDPRPRPTPTPTPPEIEWQETSQDKVLLRLSTDKKTYLSGEEVTVTWYLENCSSEPVPYTKGSIGLPVVNVVVNTWPYGGTQFLWEKGKGPSMLLPAVTSDILRPGQRIIRKVVWDQQIHTYPDHIQAPSGEYTISAGLLLGDYYSDKNELQPLTVTTTIEIR